MIPSHFMTLEALPLTPNGKVDRRSLPLPAESSIAPIVLPQTPIEQQLVEIWQQVLGLPSVSVQDNFFEIGGDSILAIQVIAQARQVGINFLPKQLFQAQTIAELAPCQAHSC
jgi:aryl carrier-like protein